MTAEVDIATVPVTAAENIGAPKAIKENVTASPANTASKTQVSASQALSISQRGRMRVPSSNTSTAMAKSIKGFQALSSLRSSRRNTSGLANAPTSMWPQARGRRVPRCSASASTTATSISSARPSTGSALRRPSSVHSGALAAFGKGVSKVIGFGTGARQFNDAWLQFGAWPLPRSGLSGAARAG